MKSCSY